MLRQWKTCLLALGFGLGAAANLSADGPTFTPIDFPGATSTQAWGINPSGDIVGFYVSADKATHAFVRSRGEYISIDYPGATSTLAWGMNTHGDVLGTYTSADGVGHNFVMSASPFSVSGQFIPIADVPGATTVVIAIHGGDIVGGYTGADKIGHGFVMSDGQLATIDAPGGATFTNVTGINSRGEMVGRYTLNGVTHAYLMSGGQFNSFDYPDATFTGSTAIGNNGDIVGRYRDANNVFHGFLLTGFRLACPSGS